MAALLALLGLALLVPWTLRIELRAGWGEGEPPYLRAEAAVWGRPVWGGRLPAPRARDGKRHPLGAHVRGLLEGRVRRLLAPRKGAAGVATLARALVPAARYLRRHVRVLRLRWQTRVGLQEAELCALAATALQLGQSAAALGASGAHPASALEIRVVPDYRWFGVDSWLDFVFRVSPLRVLLAGVRLVLALRRAASHSRPTGRPC